MAEKTYDDKPLRFRTMITRAESDPRHGQWSYGCYFPATDLVVGDMGMPQSGVEWIDDPAGIPWYKGTEK